MARIKRASNDPVVVARMRGPEFTKVGMETEVKIPFRTWLVCILVSVVDVVSVVAILILISRQFYNWRHPPRIYGQSWGASVWRSLVIWSPSIGIFALGGVLLWSLPLLYRFLVETVAKHPPQYTPYPSENGLWNPLGDRIPDEDGEEYEAEAKPQTVDLNVWDMIKGKKKMRQAPDLMVDTRARQFYRALANGAAAFSERGAKRYGIKPGEFRKYIREPLRHKGLATWKDERRHNLGVNLSDNALVSLGHLGNAPTPPRRSA